MQANGEKLIINKLGPNTESEIMRFPLYLHTASDQRLQRLKRSENV